METRPGLQTMGVGLRADSFPMRLYEKAKRLGVWDPSAIDFSRDREDWQTLTDEQQAAILQLTSLFQAGEEAVTLDLLPLVLAIAREGRLEEELYLTTFLWEEGKHTQFFARFLDEVAGSPSGLDQWHTPSYRTLIYDELPRAMQTLLVDPGPAAQARAAVTYNMIVEGVLAETGYESYHRSLQANALMPGMCGGLVHVKQDEARHIAYGVYLLGRLVAADPDLWDVVEARMNELLPISLGLVSETFERYEEGKTPFGLEQDEFVAFATSQFQKRYDRIARARERPLGELEQELVAEA